ncbi:MAG: PIG-L family deacetylase [Anaerolineales bacterium]|nr:PIG-L family deacetylase [Anaerolineales bacterium]
MPSLLCLVAHPDDETMLTGGTLALLAAQQVAVHVVCLTRGEGGEMGEPPLVTRSELGDRREAEMVCAVGKLGGRSLSFLGYVDPTVGPGDALFAPAHDLTMLTGQIAASLKQVQAQVLLSHGSNGEYGHPAHQLVHQSARLAAASLGEAAPVVYSFAANYAAHPYPRLANADDPADLVVDVAAALDKKIAAALCHATQNALFVRRRSEAAGRRLSVAEVLLREESFHRHWPAEPPAHDPFVEWLKPYTIPG